MKKILYIISMAVILAAIPFRANAEVTATDISNVDYALYIPNLEGIQGNQVTLPIYLKNAKLITAWQTDLVLPDGLSFACDDSGAFDISISDERTSASRHSVTSNLQTDGSLRILCSSGSNKIFLGNDGVVVNIKVNISKAAQIDTVPICLKNQLMVEADETSHELDEYVSAFAVNELDMFDLNRDGLVDIADVNILIKRICTPNTK